MTPVTSEGVSKACLSQETLHHLASTQALGTGQHLTNVRTSPFSMLWTQGTLAAMSCMNTWSSCIKVHVTYKFFLLFRRLSSLHCIFHCMKRSTVYANKGSQVYMECLFHSYWQFIVPISSFQFTLFANCGSWHDDIWTRNTQNL